jgi:hypothetical protein
LILAVWGLLTLAGSGRDGESLGAGAPLQTPTQETGSTPTATPTSNTAVAGVQPLEPPTVVVDLPAQEAPAPSPTASLEPTIELPLAPTATLEAAPSSTSTDVPPSPTSTSVPPATPTVAAIDCVALATVAETAPSVKGTQTATGQLSCSGKPVSGATMAALFSFGNSTGECNSVSDSTGVARCSLSLAAATPGQYVSVSVCFAYQNGSYCKQTGFIPQ